MNSRVVALVLTFPWTVRTAQAAETCWSRGRTATRYVRLTWRGVGDSVSPAFRVLQWWGEEGGDERLSSSVEL